MQDRSEALTNLDEAGYLQFRRAVIEFWLGKASKKEHYRLYRRGWDRAAGFPFVAFLGMKYHHSKAVFK